MVEIRIQHRAGRREALARVIENLDTYPCLVIADDEEALNPWRGYRKCLSDLPESGHVAVIQDDVLVCRNFGPAMERVAAANPDTVVTLFLSRVPRRTLNLAFRRYGKSRYVDVHPADLVHVVGILWPVARANAFLSWVDANQRRLRDRNMQVSDDATLTRWMQFSKERIRATVPSLVQHPDDLPSIVNAHRVRHGQDKGRTSEIWIGDADPLELDWTS
jgi:hypothetical protein